MLNSRNPSSVIARNEVTKQSRLDCFPRIHSTDSYGMGAGRCKSGAKGKLAVTREFESQVAMLYQ